MAADLSAWATPDPVLVLAERWATELGNVVSRIEGSDLAGKKIPGLEVKHLGYTMVISHPSSTVVNVAMNGQAAPDFGAKARTLPAERRVEIYLSLQREILTTPRVGYTLFPPNIVSIDQMTGFSLSEVLQIRDGDASTFNRFADAIQEVVSVFIRVQFVLNRILGQSASGSRNAPPTEPTPIYG